MINEYTIQAVRDQQDEARRTAQLQNIRRLQKKVNDARAELEEAQLQLTNDIMSQEGQDQ